MLLLDDTSILYTTIELIFLNIIMRILVAVMSCQKHNWLWPGLRERGVKDMVIFTGGHDQTHYDEYWQDLRLKCSDTYEGLPEKVITMIDAILNMPEFADVTHVLKVDDHDTYFNKGNIDNLYNIDTIKWNDYVGQRYNTWGSPNYHFGKVTPGCFWDNHKYEGHYVDWLDGGCTYILSRKAMEAINRYYNPSTLHINKINQ